MKKFFRFLLLSSLQSILVLSLCAQVQDSDSYVPPSDFQIPEDLEMNVWATSPFLFNPSNMDTDREDWIRVSEGVNYRRTLTRPAGDRIVVLEDSDRRPGQPIAVAHWRQEDPGILPAGDV